MTLSNHKNVSCTSDTPHAVEIKALRGVARLDNIVVHYEANADLNSALPAPVKTGL